MGGSYYVPRSVKGESRILYIFSVKALVVTIFFAIIGFLVYRFIALVVDIALIPGLIIIVAFGAIGYALTSLKIPDIPQMGVLRKAGGENIGNMLVRLFTFKHKKKLYLYGYKRKVEGGKN